MKRELLSSFGVLCGLAAATVFLCARPAAAPSVTTRPAPAPVARKLAVLAGKDLPAVADLAVQAGDLGSRADRHASDALHLAAQGLSPEDDLGWDYVQLRL
ncbi:hypothetical protein P3W85_19895 [Cupriavidus basilensis]|uniref:Uncharacterized protein n=1 Tax=Cupriavidus basilensis TaxID=68895 RepID=A0ABT6ARF5_9BURK|nr:hypothetical protein [Cupriavidus basilensis]MDF3835206.1 hypothetical protein [Cupriavidus basilensis]